MDILHQTLGELLRNNTQAQNLIMKSMQLNPEQFQELLTKTNNNPMMNQTIGELFKNGTMQQAASQGGQVSHDQIQQVVSTLQTQNVQQQAPLPQPPAEKPSFLQKLKGLFK